MGGPDYSSEPLVATTQQHTPRHPYSEYEGPTIRTIIVVFVVMANLIKKPWLYNPILLGFIFRTH